MADKKEQFKVLKPFLDAIASREPALLVGWLVGGHFLKIPSLTCNPSKRSTFSFSRTIVGQE